MKHAKIRKWGNSLAVRIPKTLVKELDLREGSGILVGGDRTGITIRRMNPSRGTAAGIWKNFLIPTGKKRKERVSETIDAILYGAHPR